MTDDALDDFLEIELPQGEVGIAPYESKYSDAHDEDHSTVIGALYDAIRQEFESLRPPMSPDNQISGPLAWFVVDTVEKVDSAATGSRNKAKGPCSAPGTRRILGDYPIFYRFWEVRKRQKIEFDEATNKFAFKTPL